MVRLNLRYSFDFSKSVEEMQEQITQFTKDLEVANGKIEQLQNEIKDEKEARR